MPDTPNKIYRFWEELKRRNVVRRNTVYAATAFVILELVSIIQDPLRLPEWTLTLVIILLSIGFVVSIILSWIYNVTPEGNIERTKPLATAPASTPSGKRTRSSSSWKIASYVSFAVILVLVVLNIIPRTGGAVSASNKDKSIAVIPFINDSPEKENEYFINGTMEAILDNLARIEDLRVVSRTSVEQYRDNLKPLPEIAREMNVSYVLEGSGQKSGNQIRLFVQLLDAKQDRHIWSSHYNHEIKDIFALQSEIARLVASELQAIITPDEEELIEKIPTTSQTAYDFFQRGMDEINKFFNSVRSRETLERAEDLFRYALEYDPVFAKAYARLATVYEQIYWSRFMPADQALDSVKSLSDRALSYDNRLPEGYYYLGMYFRETGDTAQAVSAYENAIKYNPNYFEAYAGLGHLYRSVDNVRSIENYQTALSINPEAAWIMRFLAEVMRNHGFTAESRTILEQAYRIDGDTLDYYMDLAFLELLSGNTGEAIRYANKAYFLDSLDLDVLVFLGITMLIQERNDSSLFYFQKFVDRSAELDLQVDYGRWVGYAFAINGKKSRGEYYINIALNQHRDHPGGSRNDPWFYITRVALFAYLGEQHKAMENLRILNSTFGINLFHIYILENDPAMESVRNSPGFTDILTEIRSKYQTDRTRIGQWLEENETIY